MFFFSISSLIPLFFCLEAYSLQFFFYVKNGMSFDFLVARHNFHIQMKVRNYTFTNGFRTHSLTLVVAFKRRGNHLRATELELIRNLQNINDFSWEPNKQREMFSISFSASQSNTGKQFTFFFFYKLQTINWNSKTKILDSINQVNHSNSFHLNSNNSNTKY